MRETPKFNLWVKYFTDPSDRECHGNATRSAIKAYGYTSPDKYNLAALTGSKNIRKYKYLATTTLDMMGFGYAELLKILMKKAIEGSFSDFERFMVRIGYFPENPDTQINIQQNNFNVDDFIRRGIEKSCKERGLPPLKL